MQCERHVCFFAHSLEELRVHVDRPAALVGLPPPGSPAAQEVFGFRSAPLKVCAVLPRFRPLKYKKSQVALQIIICPWYAYLLGYGVEHTWI